MTGFATLTYAQSRLALAERYVYALYPEVQGQTDGIEIKPVYPPNPNYVLSSKMQMFTLRLRERPKGKGPFGDFDQADQMNPPVGPMLLSILFRMPLSPNEAQPSQISAYGPFVNQERWDRLKNLVNDHPEWSREDALRTLKDAGARFGPDAKDDLLRALPLRKLEPMLGKATILSSEFRVRAPQVAGATSPPPAKLEWTVEITVKKPGRPALIYGLICEPFGGKIVEMIGGKTLKDYRQRIEHDIQRYGREAVQPKPS